MLSEGNRHRMNSLLLFQAQLLANYPDVNEERVRVRNNLQVLFQVRQSNKADLWSNIRVVVRI